MTSRRQILARGAGAVACAFLQPAMAAFPDRPIKIIVPYGAGGAADVVARKLATHMSGSLGQTVIVDNRPGGNTIIGASAVAASEKDGSTLLFEGLATFLQPLLARGVPYQASDFTPVSLVGRFPFVLIARPGLGVNNPRELLELARAKPGQLTYGHTGQGTMAHLMAEMMFQTMGISVKGVPYKGGAQAQADLIGGHIDLSMDALLTSIGGHRIGTVKIIGTLGTQRYAAIPEVPTFIESGFPTLGLMGWTGIFAPVGTPTATIEKVNDAVRKAFANEEFNRQIFDFGQFPAPTTAAEAKKHLETELAVWGPFIKKLGLQPA